MGVDPPPPFSRLSVALLERVGDAVLGAVCAQLQRVFVRALAADYKRWACDEEYRLRRAAWQAVGGGDDGVARAAAESSSEA